MKILDARADVIDDADSLRPIRKSHGRDPNALTIHKLRDQPEAALLAKRMKKHNGESTITPLANPMGSGVGGQVLHARIHSADEAKRTFYADMDQSSGMSHYARTKKAMKDLPAHFHGPSNGPRKGKPAGDLDFDYDDTHQRIRLKGTVHDEDEWNKISQGVYGNLRISHDRDGRPVHVALTDTKASEPQKYLKLQKKDRSMSTVAIKPQGTVGVSPMLKRDGTLDPFRQIFSRPPQRGR